MATKQSKSLLGGMEPYIKGFKLPFLLSVVGAIIASLITVIGPYRLKEITDLIRQGLATGIDLGRIGQISLSLGLLYLLGWLINYGQGYIMNTIVHTFAKRLRFGIAEKINRLPLGYFDSHAQGDTLSRVTNDVDTATQALNQSLGTVMTSATLLLGSIVMMLVTDVKMTLTALVSVFLGYVVTFFLMGKSQPLFAAQQANLGRINGFIEEVYTGHSVISSYGAVKEVTDEFQTLNANLYTSMWKSQFISGIMMPLMIFIGNFAYVMVCVVGAALALQGDITIGTIVAFMTYVRIFSQPLSQIAQSITQLQSASAALGRIFEFLDEAEMADESHKTQQLRTIKGQVDFDQVSFGYSKDKTIIHNFTAQAKAGQKVAIVGPTGAGKTTLVNLLMKFYEIDSGRIAIDGVDINDMTREEVHSAFSMVLQDTWLFEGTIRDNLVYNQEMLTDDQVVAAAKAVGVHHFIMTLPQGYDTVLDDALSLSVGQKQLLTIARALLKDAPLLILDEATSSVDTRTEILIQSAMDTLMEGRTSFVIAHRLSTIKNADLILVMKEGNIIEQGNHDQLMTAGGFYADLYNSQFSE